MREVFSLSKQPSPRAASSASNTSPATTTTRCSPSGLKIERYHTTMNNVFELQH